MNGNKAKRYASLTGMIAQCAQTIAARAIVLSVDPTPQNKRALTYSVRMLQRLTLDLAATHFKE